MFEADSRVESRVIVAVFVKHSVRLLTKARNLRQGPTKLGVAYFANPILFTVLSEPTKYLRVRTGLIEDKRTLARNNVARTVAHDFEVNGNTRRKSRDVGSGARAWGRRGAR